MKMVTSRYTGTDKFISLRPIGDLHIGHVNCNYALLNDTLKTTSEESRIILMGDLLECATKESVGKSVFETNLTPKQQIERVCDILTPYKSFIDGAVMGNHETRISNMTSLDVMEIICNKLDVPYLGFQGVVKYAWNEVCYTVNMWHGKGSGSSVQSALKSAEDMANRMFSDVYCMGHKHLIGTTSRVFKFPDTRNNFIKKINQHFVLTGSCLEANDGYAEETGLQERVLGFPEIVMSMNKRKRFIKVITEG